MQYTSSDHTFVVCAYKENPFLEDTVVSLLAQQERGPVLLSTSTPNGHIEQISKKYGVPLAINNSSQGAAHDWNFGYDAAATPLVTIAHQDDFYEPSFLSAMLDAINKYPPEEIEFAFSDYFEIRNNSITKSNALLRIKRVLNAPLALPLLNGQTAIKKGVLSFGNPICCPAVTLFKRNLGASVFDEQYKNSCDYKTWVDLAKKPGRFIYVPKTLMGHRIYEESSTSLNLQNGTRQKEDLEILGLLWPSPLARLIYRVYSAGEKSNQTS